MNRRASQGLSLLTVLALLLLCLIAAMGSLRVVALNELLLGNSADQARAQAAALALLSDAEVDIRGRLPPYTLQADGQRGSPCRADAEQSGYSGCREIQSGASPWFPQSNAEFDQVGDILAAGGSGRPCKQAICLPSSATAIGRIEDQLTAMAPLGATYGQYTRAALPAPGPQGNPILAGTGANARAWYWIEGFRYGDISASPLIAKLRPEPERAFIYRITAVALGLKPGTRVVMQAIFVPYPANQNR